MPTATATGGGGADAAPLRCASSLRMARRLLRTAYRSACARSRSSRLPARERGAGVQRCQREGRRRAERRGAEGGGAARRAVLRGGGERRLGEHALQLLLLLLLCRSPRAFPVRLVRRGLNGKANLLLFAQMHLRHGL